MLFLSSCSQSLGFHSRKYKDYCLVGCCTMQSDRNFLAFQSDCCLHHHGNKCRRHPSLPSFSFYIKWFQNHLSDRFSFIHISGKFSSPSSELMGVPQGCAVRPLLFKVFINDLRAEINHSKFLIFADLKIYWDIKSVEDCKLHWSL